MGSGTSSSAVTSWLVFAFVFGVFVTLMTIAIGIRSWRRRDGRFGSLNVLVLTELIINLALLALALVVDAGHAPSWLQQMGGAIFAVAGGLALVIGGALVAHSVRVRVRR